jgi:predicted ATP-grasp superfamily ATP-dependent carboligase
VVLGCHKLGLGVIRALGKMGVPVFGAYYNPNDMGYASRYVLGHCLCPHPDTDERGFVEALLNKASDWGGAVLMPSDDATLIPVSRHKEELACHYRVSAADWPVIETCIHKQYTYQLADRLGVPCPRTRIPESGEEAQEFARQIGFPCLLKPCVGHQYFEHFRRKMEFVNTPDELRRVYRDAESVAAKMMIQEFIPGGDTAGVNYNSFFIDGEPQVEVTAEKVRLSPPRLGFPRVVVSKRIPAILEPARTLLRGLSYTGFSCMEFKKDARDGIYKLMEINARQNLSTPLSVRSGVNFPYLTYHHLLSGERPISHPDFQEGVYWIDAGKDLLESIKSFRQEHYTFTQYLRPYLAPHVYSIPSWDDPRPFFKRSLDLVSGSGQLLLKRIFSK